MIECFVPKNFHNSSLVKINQAIEIINEYAEDNLTLTLRQLYYQFVQRNWLPNTVQSYKQLGSVINDARLAGMIDWDAIEDRTRFLREIENYENVQDFLDKMKNRYAEDLWRGQPFYCEVWIEKDALIGVIERICNRWRVPYFSCRGYASQSEMYNAAKRLEGYTEFGKQVRVFHLGDHDPSGLDMTNDNASRLELMTYDNESIAVERLALNMDQIDLYNPPPNPAKETDSRHAAYAERFGDSSWELDALNPRVIRDLIDDAVQNVLDPDLWERAIFEEREHRADYAKLVKTYPGLVNLIRQGTRIID